MSGQKRFTDGAPLTGRIIRQIRELFESVFASSAEIQNFVREKLAKGMIHNIDWSKPTTYAISDLIDHHKRNGGLGGLLERLQEDKPGNKEVADLINYLVEASYLVDEQASQPAANTNPKNIDWAGKYPQDVVGFSADDRALVVDALCACACFRSAGSVERFLCDNFKNQFSEKMRHGIVPTEPVTSIMDKLVIEFERKGWLNAFLLAAQDADKSNPMLIFITMKILEALKPAPVAASRAPAVFVTRAATPIATAPAAKVFRVVRSTGKLNANQLRELRDLIVRAFDGNGLSSLCHSALDEHLDVIVASGPLRKVADDLLRWCEEQENKLVPLLNAIVKARPGRDDVKPLLEKLASEGVIEIEK